MLIIRNCDFAVTNVQVKHSNAIYCTKLSWLKVKIEHYLLLDFSCQIDHFDHRFQKGTRTLVRWSYGHSSSAPSNTWRWHCILDIRVFALRVNLQEFHPVAFSGFDPSTWPNWSHEHSSSEYELCCGHTWQHDRKFCTRMEPIPLRNGRTCLCNPSMPYYAWSVKKSPKLKFFGQKIRQIEGRSALLSLNVNKFWQFFFDCFVTFLLLCSKLVGTLVLPDQDQVDKINCFEID